MDHEQTGGSISHMPPHEDWIHPECITWDTIREGTSDIPGNISPMKRYLPGENI
jgi:hypothetical protein